MAILPQRLDITLAFKAIGLLESLSTTDKRVAIAIVDSFNSTTGQCDPGLGRIAHLLGISRRTVIRSISRLENAKVLTRLRYRGNSHRNSYQPNWAYFRQLEEAWRARKQTKHWVRADQDEMSLSVSQSCHLGDGKLVTQTITTNHSNETSRPSPPAARPQKLSPKNKRSNTFSAVDLHVSPSHREISFAAAERRWTTELNRRFAQAPETYALILEAIDPELQRVATEAESQCKGAGIRLIVARLRMPRHALGSPT